MKRQADAKNNKLANHRHRLTETLARLDSDQRLSPPSAEAFWHTFRERAEDRPQLRFTPQTAKRHRFAALALATAAALLLSLTLWSHRLSSENIQGSHIEIVDVSARTESFMIWEDAQGKGTVVWLIAQAPIQINGG